MWNFKLLRVFNRCQINPFTARACNISGLKDAGTRLQACYIPVKHVIFRSSMLYSGQTCYIPVKHVIFRSCNTSTFSVMRLDENPFTCQCEKEDKRAYSLSWCFTSTEAGWPVRDGLGLQFQILHIYVLFSDGVMEMKGFKKKKEKKKKKKKVVEEIVLS